jgi:hypothetical protein
MPWQAVPALMVIAGAFTATGVLMRVVDEAAYGKVSFIFIICNLISYLKKIILLSFILYFFIIQIL